MACRGCKRLRECTRLDGARGRCRRCEAAVRGQRAVANPVGGAVREAQDCACVRAPKTRWAVVVSRPTSVTSDCSGWIQLPVPSWAVWPIRVGWKVGVPNPGIVVTRYFCARPPQLTQPRCGVPSCRFNPPALHWASSSNYTAQRKGSDVKLVWWVLRRLATSCKSAVGTGGGLTRARQVCRKLKGPPCVHSYPPIHAAYRASRRVAYFPARRVVCASAPTANRIGVRARWQPCRPGPPAGPAR